MFGKPNAQIWETVEKRFTPGVTDKCNVDLVQLLKLKYMQSRTKTKNGSYDNRAVDVPPFDYTYNYVDFTHHNRIYPDHGHHHYDGGGHHHHDHGHHHHHDDGGGHHHHDDGGGHHGCGGGGCGGGGCGGGGD